MEFDLTVIMAHIPDLLRGAGVTLFVSLLSIALGMVGGFVVCFTVISHSRAVRCLGLVYISFLRGTPILVLLLIVFYMLPVVGIEAPPLVAAIAALTLNTAAFQAEIYRGGFASIPGGQAEAAKAVGMNLWQTRRRVLVPQVLRLVTPSLVNEVIVLLKNSSLVSVIAVTELMRVSQQVVAKTYQPTEIYVAAAFVYLLMNLGLAWAGHKAQKRLGRYL